MPKRKSTLRERFLKAALRLASNKGVNAVTTVALARAVGVPQPNFYACFQNVDDCLRALAVQIGEAFVAENAKAFASVSTSVDNQQYDLEVSVAFHEDLIDRLLANARVTELFIRHRHDESAFGLALRELEAQEIDRAAAHLIRWARAAGLSAKHDPELRLLAEFHVGAATTGVLSLLEKRATNRPAVARALAVNADATTRATIARLMPTRRKRA